MDKKQEDIIEKEIESVLPRQFTKETHKHPLIYIVGLAISLLLIIGLAIWLFVFNANLSEQRDLIAGLNVDLQEKADQLETLEGSLNKSEEGRKQVEAAKSKVEAAKSVSDKKAASEGQRANSAESQAAQARRDLNTTLSQLASKKKELAAANSCVALFGTVKNLVSIYDSSMYSALTNLNEALGATLRGQYQLAIDYLDASRSHYNQAKGYYSQIENTLNMVGSGRC